jgi:hypothetical protein
MLWHAGRHPQIDRELFGLLDEIKRLRGLCDEAAAELDRQNISERTGKPL